jgi:hypothetical protein
MSDNASPPQEEKRVAPDQLPLPALPAAIDYDLAIAVTDARVQLYEELNRAWTICFPKEIPTDRSGNLLIRVDPTEFFPPFITYGVKYYDAYAHALLQLQPNYSDYEGWINFALKTLVCDELAPYRAVGERHQRVSQWQSHMGATWRVFDHPNHSALYPAANKLINGLEDVMEPLWEMFLDALHNAMSRRMLPLMAEGLKRLRPAAPAPGPAPIDPSPEAGTSAAVEFPKRAQWLADRLLERSWNKHDLAAHRGPDQKTIQKVLDGKSVRPDALEKIARGLTAKLVEVKVLEIPRD